MIKEKKKQEEDDVKCKVQVIKMSVAFKKASNS